MPSPAGLADVSYSVRFEIAALVQLNGLPAAAFDALVQRVVNLVGRAVGRIRDTAR
jgi:hypothetical protein